MKKIRAVVFTAFAVFGGTLKTSVVAGQVSAPAESVRTIDDDKRLRTLLTQSSVAFESGDIKRSRELLLEAWKLKQTHDIAGNIAQAELELGNYVSAAKFTSFALKYFPPSNRAAESLERLEATKREFTSLRNKVATARIRVHPAVAEVSIDGARVGDPPFGLDEVFISPGEHVLEAKHEGEKVSQSFVVKAGEERQFDLRVPASAAPDAQPASAMSVVAEQYSRPAKASPVVLVLGSTLAVAGVAAGIGFQVASSSARAELDKARPTEDYACHTPSANQAQCSELSELRDDVRRAKDFSRASFALGGTALVATAIYWLWPRRSVNIAIAPSISRVELGMTAVSRF